MAPLQPHLSTMDHVIWDWNGTLLNDLEHAVLTVNHLLALEKLPAITLERYKQDFGFPVIDYYRKLGFSTEPEKFGELCERFNDFFHAGIGSCELWPGAREMLASIKQSGKRQSILSASEQGLLRQQVTRFGVEHCFDLIAGIADKKAGCKIDRGREVMRHIGVKPEKTIMIGDTDHDLEVAEALGIELILVDHGHQCATRLRKVHHRVMKVTGA